MLKKGILLTLFLYWFFLLCPVHALDQPSRDSSRMLSTDGQTFNDSAAVAKEDPKYNLTFLGAILHSRDGLQNRTSETSQEQS